MLHTLGLDDQYQDNMETKTIMYYADTYDAPLDLTDLDKHIVNTVYTVKVDNQDINISSRVQLPDTVKITEAAVKNTKEKYGNGPEL